MTESIPFGHPYEDCTTGAESDSKDSNCNGGTAELRISRQTAVRERGVTPSALLVDKRDVHFSRPSRLRRWSPRRLAIGPPTCRRLSVRQPSAQYRDRRRQHDVSRRRPAEAEKDRAEMWF